MTVYKWTTNIPEWAEVKLLHDPDHRIFAGNDAQIHKAYKAGYNSWPMVRGEAFWIVEIDHELKHLTLARTELQIGGVGYLPLYVEWDYVPSWIKQRISFNGLR